MRLFLKSRFGKLFVWRIVAVLTATIVALICPVVIVSARPDLTTMRASAVWVVAAQKNKDSSSTGSGFLVGSGDCVVTNWHVVQSVRTGAKIFVVAGKNNVIPGTIIGYSEVKDLAIIKLERKLGRPIVQFENRDNVNVGEEVYVVGFPTGPVSSDQMSNITAIDETVTKGIVSRKLAWKNGVNYYQTDAAINPGNSGGPMFNERGKVIGIVTARMESSGTTRIDGAGLAIQIDELFSELSRLNIPYNQNAVLVVPKPFPSEKMSPSANGDKVADKKEQEKKERKLGTRSFLYPAGGLVVLSIIGLIVFGLRNR